jgi:hypothetical protein
MFERERVAATVVIWTLSATIMIVGMVAGSSSFGDDEILTLSIAAMLTTRFVWNAKLGMSDAGSRHSYSLAVRKAKRTEGGRVGRLLDSLDVDEIEEPRSRLEIEDDTEATTFDELLSEHKSNNYYDE